MKTEIKEIVSIILPIFIGLGVAGIQRWWLGYKTKKFKLIDHPLFTDLVLSIRDLKNWKPTKNRQVFINALEIKFTCWKVQGEILAKELQSTNFSNLQLQNKVLKWASNVIDLYTSEWIKNGIPELIINRITEVHEENVQQFLLEIKQISFSSDMYPFKMQKVIAIFDTLRLLLADTKNDFNKLVYREKYNGDFVGTLYKGVPINDNEFEKYLIKLKNDL